jgi:periplasmic protein TonB
MDLTTWNQTDLDEGRTKRLAIGYATAVGMCLAIGAAGLALSGRVEAAPADDEIDVKLATTADVEAAKPAEPPPPPANAAPAPAELPPGPKKRALRDVSKVPTGPLPEGDPAIAKPASGGGEDTYGNDDGTFGRLGHGAPAKTAAVPVAAPPPVVAAPAPPPRAAGPVQLPENATPPVALANAQPGYPEEARRASIEAVVVVKFVVTESGEVTGVTIVRGHPMFDAAVLAAVRTWRYRPAIYEGRPIRVYRTAKLPFKLKT